MIPVSLKLANFTSYGEKVLELDFTKFHLAAISGPNGAGKSSLLDAITWCVWGWSRAGDNADQLVRLGAQNMFVEFSFELDNHTYTVTRARLLKHGGSTALELWSGSISPSATSSGPSGSPLHNLTEGTIKATQQKIIDLLHLTFETFTNSSFLRQGHADEFTTKGPTDRKRILSDILGLSHYDKLEEKAKEKIKESDSKLKLLEYQLLEIEAELSQKEERETKKKAAEEKVQKVEKDIKVFEDNIKILRAEKEALTILSEQKNKLQQNFLDAQKEMAEITNQGISRKSRIDNLKKEITNLNIDEKVLVSLSSLQKEKDSLEKIRRQRLELEKKISETNSSLNLKKQQLENLKNQIDDLNTKLNSLSKTSAKCPTCGQVVDALHKIQVQKNLNEQKKEFEEKIKNINTKNEEKQIISLEEKLSSLKFDDQKYQDLSTKLSNLETLQKQKEKLIEIKATIDSEEKVILEMRSLFASKKTQVEKFEAELKALPEISDKLQNVNRKLEQSDKQLVTLRSQEKEAQSFLGQVTQLISRSKQLEELFKKKQIEKMDLQKEKGVFEKLALAFGKKGIQAMIIETAIPEIEDEANRLLDRLTEGRMRVKFETQRETKTKLTDGEKGVVETLDIIISDEMGERPYELYSGGEAFRVNFAIRIALSKLLTRRAGAKLQFLVIDEGFGTQDQEGRTKIVEVLDTIKNDFEKILVITHLEELKEEFPVRIEVSKNSQGSTFELVGS